MGRYLWEQSSGQEYQINEVVIGTESRVGPVFTNTPVRVKIAIKNILPGTEAFRSVMLNMSSTEIDSLYPTYTFTQISNLAIEW